MVFIEFVKFLLPLLVLLSDISLITVLLIFVFQKFIFKKELIIYDQIASLVKKHGLKFAFIVALTATSGSLFYSEVLGWNPCKLCWYQRILMYPQVIILAMAIKKRARDIADYIVPMGIIGAIIAAFHHYIQIANYAATCGIGGADCAVKYTFNYGYITIPMMALTAFILTGILTYTYKKAQLIS